MLSISKHANLHFGTRNVGQLNRATKPLILLWVIIFQANLKLNGLGELAWLLIHTILYGCHSFSDGIPRKLTASKENIQNPPKKSVLGLKDQRTQIQEQKKKPVIFATHTSCSKISTRALRISFFIPFFPVRETRG
jgi:hypothetical protein